jgi:hypothetical protein
MPWYLQRINANAFMPSFPAKFPNASQPKNAFPNRAQWTNGLSAPPLTQRPTLTTEEPAWTRQVLSLSVRKLTPRSLLRRSRRDRRGSLFWRIPAIEVRACGRSGSCGPCCGERIGAV